MIKPYRIHQLAETASTNDDAKKAADAGEVEGLVIWSLKQTAGRGRHGRAWESPQGNLHASILLRPGCEMRHAGHYGFIAALALHDTVRALLPQARIRLKWPNDVLADGKKISGILLETSSAPNRKIHWLVIGIGLNAEHHPENTPYPATSLGALGASPAALPDILNALLGRFFRWKKTLEKQGFAPVRAAWLENAQKGQLSVRLPDQTIKGAFDTLDDNGNLVLQLADGSKKAIAAGDVFFGS